MFLRLLLESFLRQRRRKLLAGIAILLGATAVTAMLGLATTIGDRIHQELAVYGANIIVYPKADTLDVKVGDQSLKPATGNAYLHESDLAKLNGIFWANNITGVSPELRLNGLMLPEKSGTGKPFDPKAVWHTGDPRMVGMPGTFPVTATGYWFNHRFGDMVTGAPQLHPLWKLDGRWPLQHAIKPLHSESAQEVVLGAKLATRLGLGIGDWINMGTEFEGDIVGIVSTGGEADDQILFPLDAYSVPTVDGSQPSIPVSRVEISARTKPEDAFARRDPDTLSPQQHEIWYCRPYANSIAYQIAEAIPGAHAEQVRQVEQSEGTILERISGLMWLISAAALLAAAVAVSAAMATAVLERRAEIGLMRSLGASKGRIASLFYAEAGLLAIGGGFCGYIAGSLLAALLTAKIFGKPTGITLHTALTHAFNPVLLPVVLALALLVAIAGSTASIRGALRMDPSAVLRADA
jgi:putative ABC transport system permease protein